VGVRSPCWSLPCGGNFSIEILILELRRVRVCFQICESGLAILQKKTLPSLATDARHQSRIVLETHSILATSYELWLKSGKFSVFFLLQILWLCTIFPPKIPLKDSQLLFFVTEVLKSSPPITNHCESECARKWMKLYGSFIIICTERNPVLDIIGMHSENIQFICKGIVYALCFTTWYGNPKQANSHNPPTLIPSNFTNGDPTSSWNSLKKKSESVTTMLSPYTCVKQLVSVWKYKNWLRNWIGY
jgi:hypothetical protein